MTVAKFDKVVSPGREGKIELAVGGDKVHGEFTKSATVDPTIRIIRT
jgi:hypothetical protein